MNTTPATQENELPIRFMYLRENHYSVLTSVTYNKVNTPCPPYIQVKRVPTAAVAIQVDVDEDKIYYSVTSMSPKVGESGKPDVFSKEFAREILTKRLNVDRRTEEGYEKTRFSIPLYGVEDRYTITGMVMQDIVDRVVDARARRERPIFGANLYKRAIEWLRENPNYAEASEDEELEPLVEAEVLGVVVDNSPKAELAYNAVD